MDRIESVFATEKYMARCEDRVALINTADRTVIVVADGAGGTSSGDVAAETVVRGAESECEHIHSGDQWSAFLSTLDCRVSSGESTAVVVDIRQNGIAGASVGDSQAWIVRNGEITRLTEKQNRKPLLGSGDATPVSFTFGPLEGILLVATDGFFDYAKRDAIISLVSKTEFAKIPQSCIEMVRLPTGELWDDIGIVAARIAPLNKTKSDSTFNEIVG